MSIQAMRLARTPRFVSFLTLLAFLLTGCGINDILTYEEQAKAKWADVLNQYQRRADLIPNLVETVKGFAKQESTVLQQVTEARAKATSVQVTAGTAVGRARPVAGGFGKLAGSEIQRQLSGSAIAA